MENLADHFKRWTLYALTEASNANCGRSLAFCWGNRWSFPRGKRTQTDTSLTRLTLSVQEFVTVARSEAVSHRALCALEKSLIVLARLRQMEQPVTTPLPPFDETGGSSTKVENSCRRSAAISSDFFIARTVLRSAPAAVNTSLPPPQAQRTLSRRCCFLCSPIVSDSGCPLE